MANQVETQLDQEQHIPFDDPLFDVEDLDRILANKHDQWGEEYLGRTVDAIARRELEVIESENELTPLRQKISQGLRNFIFDDDLIGDLKDDPEFMRYRRNKRIANGVFAVGMGLVMLAGANAEEEDTPVDEAANIEIIDKVTADTDPLIETGQTSTLNYQDLSEINGVDPEITAEALKYLIDVKGVTPKGASYLAANFIRESALDPTAIGDNGKAIGIGQWRDERQYGMPDMSAPLEDHLDFALLEMIQDGEVMGHDLFDILHDENATDEEISQAILDWERPQGDNGRSEWGRQIFEDLNS